MTSERVYLGRRREMTVEDWLALGWTRAEALRYARPHRQRGRGAGRRRRRQAARGDLVRHSPTGFEWGYLGLGRAELARCILVADYRAARARRPVAGRRACRSATRRSSAT